MSSERAQLAYVISAYKNLGQVARLTRRLLTESSVVLVHVDRKTDSRAYRELVSDVGALPAVTLLDRHTCHWGGFGHVRATLKGIDALVRSGILFDHLVLLTGQDYPIKPIPEIEGFFADNRGRSFMGHSPLPSPHWSPRGGLDRIEYRHVRFRDLHIRLPGRRDFPAGLQPHGGGAYWCLSRECIELVHRFVEDRGDVLRFFERVDIPDEIFFQTVVMSSELAGSVTDDNLRYIDWSRGPRPAVLGLPDLPALRSSTKLFARKFDVTMDPAVLDAVDRDLLGVA